MIRSETSRLRVARAFRKHGTELCLAAGLAGFLSAPAHADPPTNVTLTVTNNVAVDWVWGTQFMFMATSAGNGTVNGDSNGWYDQGAAVNVTGMPANYYQFAMWTGTVNSVSNPLALVMDQPYFLAAVFVASLATNGTPEWWLAQYGLTNRDWDVEALDDQDHDGMPTWAEWVSDTDPTNGDSVLRILSLQPDTGGVRVFWTGGTGVWQYLLRRYDCQSTSTPWGVIFTNVPPVPAATNVVDLEATNPRSFYRIESVRP
jgi:hypothetical protein